MNFEQLKREVYQQLEEVEGSPVRWSDEDIGDAINEGLEELSDSTEFYERYATITLRQYAAYHDLRTILPDTVLRITAIFSPTNNKWLTPKDLLELDRNRGQWEKAFDQPTNYLLRGLWWLGLYPIDTAESTVRVYYRAVHPPLVEAVDEPQQIPEDMHDALADYATYTLLSDDAETTPAVNLWNRYQTVETELAAKSFQGGRAAHARIKAMGAKR